MFKKLLVKWFRSSNKKRVFEYIGPGVPSIRICAKICSYQLDAKSLFMNIEIGGAVISVRIPDDVPKEFPLGTEIRLRMEKA